MGITIRSNFVHQGSDHFPQLAKLESRLDTEASNCMAKFDELTTSLKELLAAEGATRKCEIEQLKMKFNQHDAMHADATSLDLKTVEDAEITTLQNRLKSENQCTLLEALIQEQQILWESRFQAAESRIDTALIEFSSLSGDVTIGFENLRLKLESTESALENSFQNNLQQLGDETRIMQQQLSNNLKEETRLRVMNLQEMSDKVENDITTMSRKGDALKLELSKELKTASSQLERTALERHTTWTASIERQMSNLTSSTQTTLDKMWQEMQGCTEELRSGFTEERSHQLKVGEEERLAFKKSHEDHMRQLKTERDTRLRQTTELRADLVKAVTKERVDRMMDISESRSDFSRVAREWQAFKNSGELGTNFPSGASPLPWCQRTLWFEQCQD